MSSNPKIMRRSVIWNSLSGMINAGQSALILIFIAHFYDPEIAGVFVIGYALANLMFTMAKYGMRNYQVTDVGFQYSFKDYRTSRFLTVGVTVLIAIGYVLLKMASGTYSPEKGLSVFLLCLWKLIDSVEDVYYGMYQQRGRLDISGFYYTIRLLFSTFLFCVLLLFKLPFQLVITVVFVISSLSAAFCIAFSAKLMDKEEKMPPASGKSQIKDLLIKCFPLFLGYSLAVYVGNLPKYLIDDYLSESVQAVFGYIMMPAFLIQVLSQFIYQPMIKGMGDIWQKRDFSSFSRMVLKQYAVVAMITGIVILGGALVGLPVLSFVYNADLLPYKWEFLVLLLGGGFFALCSFMAIPLITMRVQNLVAIGYAGAAILGLVLGKLFVTNWGMMGAAMLYCLINFSIAGFYTICFLLVISLRKNGQSRERWL